MSNPRFRNAYALKPGFKLHSLKPHCNRIVFVTDGVESGLDRLKYQITDSLKYFDPGKDCIIPLGSVTLNLLAGAFLALKFPDDEIYLGIYNHKNRLSNHLPEKDDYVFYPFQLNTLEKVEE